MSASVSEADEDSRSELPVSQAPGDVLQSVPQPTLGFRNGIDNGVEAAFILGKDMITGDIAEIREDVFAQPVDGDPPDSFAADDASLDHPHELIVHAGGRIPVFSKHTDDDGPRQSARLQTTESGDHVERDPCHPIPIAHICPTFRDIVDTRHGQILP